MQEKDLNKKDYIEIDMREILFILIHRIWLIILVTFVAGGAAFAITQYCITPQYSASVKLYVNNSTEVNTDITSSDVLASHSLVDTYITIIQSNTVLDEVIANTGVSCTPQYIASCMSASAINSTEVFQVTITTPYPKQSAKIANAIADVTPHVLAEIVSGSSVKIVDRAKVPTSPSSPNMMKNTAIGCFVGFMLSCIVIILMAVTDTRIKTEADLARISSLPMLGAITEFHMAANKGYGYRYGTKPEKSEGK